MDRMTFMSPRGSQQTHNDTLYSTTDLEILERHMICTTLKGTGFVRKIVLDLSYITIETEHKSFDDLCTFFGVQPHRSSQ